MKNIRVFLLILTALIMTACAQVTPGTSGTLPTSTGIPTLQETVTMFPSPTASMTPSPTPPPGTPTPTFSPLMATALAMGATQSAMMGSMGLLSNITQYFHPVGTPVATWKGIPVMPQASAGQEWTSQIYSYTVKSSLEQGTQFYASQSAALGIQSLPATSFGMLEGKPTHDVIFYSYPLTIMLYSYNSAPQDMIVLIAKE